MSSTTSNQPANSKILLNDSYGCHVVIRRRRSPSAFVQLRDHGQQLAAQTFLGVGELAHVQSTRPVIEYLCATGLHRPVGPERWSVGNVLSFQYQHSIVARRYGCTLPLGYCITRCKSGEHSLAGGTYRLASRAGERSLRW